MEAVLLLAREALGSRKLADLAGLADGTEARTLVRKLNRLYDEEGCAFRVVEVAGGFQLMTRPKFAPWLRRLHSSLVEVRLSAPAMETLAVIAYRQPMMRADIEAVRGVQCGEILRQLMERDLVRIVGRAEELGRPFLYGTTKQFLRVFGLRHLDELPRPAGFEPQPTEHSAAPDEDKPEQEPSNQPTIHSKKEGELTVKTAAQTRAIVQDPIEELEERSVTLLDPMPSTVIDAKDDDDLDDDDDLEDDDDLDDDDEDEGFEDEDWEEVDDDDADEEEEDWDEDEDEDWDEDDGDDWDDDEEEEDEEEEDWE